MIQRIQSLYLLGIVAVLAFVMIPDMRIGYGSSVNDLEKTEFNVSIFKTVFTTTRVKLNGQNPEKVEYYNNSLLYVLFATGLLAFTAIFLYSRRALQFRLVALNFLFIIISFFYIYYSYYKAVSIFNPPVDSHFSMVIMVLILIPILNFFAMRGIKRDIVLLASSDRLR